MAVKHNIFFIILVLLMTAVGCKYDEFLDKIVDDEEEAFARSCFADLRAGNYEEMKKHFNEDMLISATDSKLDSLRRYFLESEPIEVKLIGARVFKSSNMRQVALTFEYEYLSGWVLTEISLERIGPEIVILGFTVKQLKQSIEEINAFTLRNKPIKHYLFLLGGIAILLFIVFTLILCIRTPMAKRKWLWIIFILFGFCTIGLNWTTGKMFTQLISIRLFGVGALTASPYAPWIIKLSIPVGAIQFLIMRKRIIGETMSEKCESLESTDKIV